VAQPMAACRAALWGYSVGVRRPFSPAAARTRMPVTHVCICMYTYTCIFLYVLIGTYFVNINSNFEYAYLFI